jgi:dTDP-glucose 4,6-dehydratase
MDRITFVQGDICDQSLVATLVKEHAIDTIVNIAAETHVDRSIQNVGPFLHSNIMGVQTLIDACKLNPQLLLVHVSTDEVYGEVMENESPRTVDSPLRPGNPYAATKAAGDLLLLAAARTHNLNIRITRCTNNYGPHQDPTKLLPVVTARALADQPIPIYGKGLQRRDWLYVTDHTDAIELVLAKGKDGQIYHVSADDDRQNIDVARAVLTLLKKPDTLIQFVTDRPGHDWRYALDSTNTRALGWKPKMSFEEGLTKTVEWYRSRTH